jgi:cobalt-zinc-cadmium efflux system outer membrane protein
MPPSIDVATEIALRERPDLKLARLNEFAAQAGLRLAKSQGSPDLSFSTTYAAGRSAFDDTPIGPLTERDKTLAFRVAIKLPIFNRNQGAKQEAAVAVTQARVHREYVEQLVRLDVASALKRFESVSRSVDSFERSVIARSEENIRAIRAAYQLGEFRITDLIAEQRRLLDSQREFTNALAERFLAFASFQTALGNRNGPRNQK